jgi:hypothetical protein
VDAAYSVRLFLKYRTAGDAELQIARDTLRRAPETAPFWKSMREFEVAVLAEACLCVLTAVKRCSAD